MLEINSSVATNDLRCSSDKRRAAKVLAGTRRSMSRWLLGALVGLAGLLPVPGSAETLVLTLSDLSKAIEQSDAEPDAIRRQVLEAIEQQLNQADVHWQAGQLVLRDSMGERTIDDGCNSTVIRYLDTDVTLRENSALALTLDSLQQPIVLDLNVDAYINARGRVRQTFGIRLFGCNEIGRDTFDVSARGPLSLNLRASISLEPRQVSPRLLQLRPRITVTGELLASDIRVDVDDTILRALLERLLQDELDDAFGPDRIESELAALQQSLSDQLGGSDGYGSIDIELPDPSDAQVMALLELLSPDADFSLTIDHLMRHRHELLAALVLGDSDRISDLLSAAAACTAATALQVPLESPPMFSTSSGRCAVADPAVPDQLLFSDSACQQPLDFQPTGFGEFCETVVNKSRLGNAADSSQPLERWTLSPGTRFDIGVLPLAGKRQPLVRRTRYKQVVTAAGTCELEMRIYSADLAGQGLRPLLALHGGSWQHRQSGFLGIEAMATQFTNAGFVVFAPFYRLIGTDDGNVECHDAATVDLLADANDALDWVQAHAADYGASGNPTVFGQSAGGHLAASLAVHRAAEIDRAALFYSPVDFVDFADQLQRGLYEGTRGTRILEAVTAAQLDTLALDTPLLVDNSFPAIISTDPGAYPPFFLLHGEADELLPFRQSARLCNALSGNPDTGPAPLDHDLSGYRRIVECDARGSELHLIAEGEHALDFCVADGLCLAGSTESAVMAGDSVQRMLEWLRLDQALLDDGDQLAGASSGGALHGPMLALLLLILGARASGTRLRTHTCS